MEEVLHQLRLVVYPIISKVLAPSQVVSRISEPSTVCLILDSAETTIGLWLRPQWPELISTTRCGYFGLFFWVPERSKSWWWKLKHFLFSTPIYPNLTVRIFFENWVVEFNHQLEKLEKTNKKAPIFLWEKMVVVWHLLRVFSTDQLARLSLRRCLGKQIPTLGGEFNHQAENGRLAPPCSNTRSLDW